MKTLKTIRQHLAEMVDAEKANLVTCSPEEVPGSELRIEFIENLMTETKGDLVAICEHYSKIETAAVVFNFQELLDWINEK